MKVLILVHIFGILSLFASDYTLRYNQLLSAETYADARKPIEALSDSGEIEDFFLSMTFSHLLSLTPGAQQRLLSSVPYHTVDLLFQRDGILVDAQLAYLKKMNHPNLTSLINAYYIARILDCVDDLVIARNSHWEPIIGYFTGQAVEDKFGFNDYDLVNSSLGKLGYTLDTIRLYKIPISKEVINKAALAFTHANAFLDKIEKDKYYIQSLNFSFHYYTAFYHFYWLMKSHAQNFKDDPFYNIQTQNIYSRLKPFLLRIQKINEKHSHMKTKSWDEIQKHIYDNDYEYEGPTTFDEQLIRNRQNETLYKIRNELSQKKRSKNYDTNPTEKIKIMHDSVADLSETLTSDDFTKRPLGYLKMYPRIEMIAESKMFFMKEPEFKNLIVGDVRQLVSSYIENSKNIALKPPQKFKIEPFKNPENKTILAYKDPETGIHTISYPLALERAAEISAHNESEFKLFERRRMGDVSYLMRLGLLGKILDDGHFIIRGSENTLTYLAPHEVPKFELKSSSVPLQVVNLDQWHIYLQPHLFWDQSIVSVSNKYILEDALEIIKNFHNNAGFEIPIDLDTLIDSLDRAMKKHHEDEIRISKKDHVNGLNHLTYKEDALIENLDEKTSCMDVINKKAR